MERQTSIPPCAHVLGVSTTMDDTMSDFFDKYLQGLRLKVHISNEQIIFEHKYTIDHRGLSIERGLSRTVTNICVHLFLDGGYFMYYLMFQSLILK